MRHARPINNHPLVDDVELADYPSIEVMETTIPIAELLRISLYALVGKSGVNANAIRSWALESLYTRQDQFVEDDVAHMTILLECLDYTPPPKIKQIYNNQLQRLVNLAGPYAYRYILYPMLDSQSRKKAFYAWLESGLKPPDVNHPGKWLADDVLPTAIPPMVRRIANSLVQRRSRSVFLLLARHECLDRDHMVYIFKSRYVNFDAVPKAKIKLGIDHELLHAIAPSKRLWLFDKLTRDDVFKCIEWNLSQEELNQLLFPMMMTESKKVVALKKMIILKGGN